MPSRLPTHSERKRASGHGIKYAPDPFYRTPLWGRISKGVRGEQPLCAMCHAAPSQVVDHVIPRSVRPDLEYERSNLQGLCIPCHNKKTAQDYRGMQ